MSRAVEAGEVALFPHFPMPYHDSTLRAGYYHAFGSQYADHTFVMLDHAGEKWAFPCFGMVAEAEGYRGNRGVKYPVDLWTPYMIGSRNVGSVHAANLSVALGMAQFSLTPKYNFRLREWEAYWDGGAIDGAACWSGIVYGVVGVCQQMCNRILWSMRTSDFLECPVNWPPSFSASYWAYGYWGKTTEPIAVALAHGLVARARVAEAMHDAPMADVESSLLQAVPPPPRTADLEADALIARTGETIGGALRGPAAGAERRAEIVGMLSNAPKSERVTGEATLMAGVAMIDAAFRATKNELDTQLLRGEVSKEEYAAKVNGAFQTMVDALRGALPAETFAALFPDTLAGGYQLVNPQQMTSDYGRIQETAKL